MLQTLCGTFQYLNVVGYDFQISLFVMYQYRITKFKRRIPACLRNRGTNQRVQSVDLFVFVCSCLLLFVVLVHL